jgi:bifunctional non-homologous end joining protein LigD
MEIEKINLFYTEGSSDKVYQVQLEPSEGDKFEGWLVNFQYGKRGSALKNGTKTAKPLPYEAAKKIYDGLVAEKTRKGYTEDASGVAYQNTLSGANFTGRVPQLLTDIRDLMDIETLILDPEWMIQEKFDGERRMVVRQNDVVSGSNKRGMETSLPLSLVELVLQYDHSEVLIDAEIIGEHLYVFDLLSLNGEDYRAKPGEERYKALHSVFGNAESDLLTVVRTAFTVEEKRAMIEEVRSRDGEGVVIKRRSAPYAPGKPASGGSQRKWKFTESATVVAGEMTAGKSSVAMHAPDRATGEMTYLGKCTLPANAPKIKEGDLIEVSYLYLHEGKGGCLFQTTFKGLRPDQDEPDYLDEFKYKPATVSASPRMR